MYMNFWYPMAMATELKDEPLLVRALGQDFVVFRDSDGNAQCLSNTCVHRGGSLAGGKMRDGNIQCPYHGWQFNGEGKCQKIPSLGKDAKIPNRTHVDAYPVEEKFGLVLAFLGDLPKEERPPIIDVKEWDQEGWRPTLVDYEVKGNYERSIENGIDPAHNEFVHDTHGFSGEDPDYSIGDMRDTSDEWGNGFWHTFNAPKLPEGEMRKVRDFEGDLEVGTGHHGPNQVWTYIHPTPAFSFHQYLFERPIDENTIHIYLLCMRNCMLEEKHDDLMNERNMYVALQDKVVIEDLHPTLTPPTNTKEMLLPADTCVVKYRQKLAEWTARGWRIDTDAVERTRGKVAYAIPSPARRKEKGWVLDAIPTVKGEAASSRLKAAS